MREICIPLPDFLEQQIANVEVTINGEKRRYNFRVESFPWEVEDEVGLNEAQRVENRINRLKQNIESYDKNWRLVQIFKPSTGSSFIQVLFKQNM
ncbi:hypothetical protein EH223_08720 [candidate division KSB1 bacterium]|nr:hypothetical protein [candidate division KSB1 bacterium]RQW03907.1 MAG: hypothetical protein EH223_08720 [candidate division KSB1 bacterium]